MINGWIFAFGLALAIEPTPTVTYQKPCLVGQRCGDACIPWQSVCTDGLADVLGWAEPQPVTPGILPDGTPPGSTILNLPRLVEATSPTLRPGAPEWCVEAPAGDRVATECLAFYQLGSTGGSIRPPPATATCPQHLRCAGVCLPAGELCPATTQDDSPRLRPFEEPEPPAERE